MVLEDQHAELFHEIKRIHERVLCIGKGPVSYLVIDRWNSGRSNYNFAAMFMGGITLEIEEL